MSIQIIKDNFLPAGTMVVSQDLYEIFQMLPTERQARIDQMNQSAKEFFSLLAKAKDAEVAR